MQTSPLPFTQQELRATLGQFATGVAIVTTLNQQAEPIGLTINSFNSVSLDPPLVLWSLAKRSHSLAAFLQQGPFCINILAVEQQPLAERFASAALNRFEGLTWTSQEHGAPILDQVAATLECQHHSHYDLGDHILFIGQVERCQRRLGATPLIFLGGRFLGNNPD